MDYQVGDYLVHEGSGVCQIEDIDDMELMGKGSRKTYYCMSPVLSHLLSLSSNIALSFSCPSAIAAI